MVEPTDEQLMVSYQLGDEAAFAVLYRRHSSRVFQFIRKRISEDAAARDVFQQVFMNLHRSRSKYSAPFPFLPWLFTLCRNAVIDRYRSSGRILETPVEVVPEPVAEEPEHPSSSPLTEGLAGLPVQQREALELRYRLEFSFEEIGQRIGTSPSNARQLVSRAVRYLRGVYAKK
jgi:RNA polymerase sigma factor (sigma-70 family)